MNIFKILANGDGRLTEPNISAFLGYLLDPNADHALGFEFLRRFLELAFPVEQDFDPTKYEYKVYFEQAFKEEEKSKNIVDIVIVCYSYNIENKKESLVHQFIENKRTIEKIFLIENKINPESKKEEQIENQLKATINELTILGVDINVIKNKIYSIYLTPENDDYINLFNQAKGLINGSHIFWKSHESPLTIKSILQNIIELNSLGKIEPINEHVIYTIKAFSQFIDSNFKSQLQEEKRRKVEGEGHSKYDVEEIENKLIKIRTNLIENKIANENDLYINMKNKSNPSLYLNLDVCKIQLLLRPTSNDIIVFNITSLPQKSKEFQQLANKFSLKVNSGPYFNVPDIRYCDINQEEKLINSIRAIKYYLQS